MRIREGGNVEINGNSATSLKIRDMDAEQYGDFKEDFIAFLLSLSDIFMEKTGYPIWNREDLVFSGDIFSGSTRAFFQKSREEFTDKKSKVGDFDVQIPNNLYNEVHQFVQEIIGMEIGDFKIYGNKFAAGQEHLLIQANKNYPEVGAEFIQVDLEYTDFVDNAPTEFAKFAHYSSWEDLENNIKGVFVKILLRSLVSTIDEREGIIIVSQKTGKPLASANKSDIKYFMGFSTDKGVRTKYAPYIDSETNKIKMIDGKECWYEKATSDSDYTQDLGAIYHLIFNEDPTPTEKRDMFSYVRTLRELLGKLPKERIEKVFKLFCAQIWTRGRGADINPNNNEEDKEVKLIAYNKFLEFYPELKKFDGEIQEYIEKYYS